MPQLWCGDKAVKLVPHRKLCNKPVIFTLSKPRISLQRKTPCWVFMLDEQTTFTFILLATRKKHLQRIMMWQSSRHSMPLLFQHPLGSVLVLCLRLWMSNWWFVGSVKTFLFYCHCELKSLQHRAYVQQSKRADCPSFDSVHTQNITAWIIHWCCIKNTCQLAISWLWTQTKSLADHLPGLWKSYFMQNWHHTISRSFLYGTQQSGDTASVRQRKTLRAFKAFIEGQFISAFQESSLTSFI